jgi:hypothetical protein
MSRCNRCAKIDEVDVQILLYESRPLKRGKGYTKRKFPTWKTVKTVPVLNRTETTICVRHFNNYGIYSAIDGTRIFASWDPQDPDIAMYPTKQFRVVERRPTSYKRIIDVTVTILRDALEANSLEATNALIGSALTLLEDK